MTNNPQGPELTPEELQTILDNLAIPSNMTRQATNQAQDNLSRGDTLLDAMHGGALDLSADGSGPDRPGEISTRETGLEVTPQIVEMRRQMVRELFPDGDASAVWESASSSDASPLAPPVIEEIVAPTPTPTPAMPSTPDPVTIVPLPAPAMPTPDPMPKTGSPFGPGVSLENDWAGQPETAIPAAGGYSTYRVLQTEIAALYGEVREVLSPEQSASKEARTLLSEASIMLKSQPDDLQPVEAKVRQVREILHQAQASQRNADTYGRPILVYLSAWLVLSLGAIVYFYLDSSLFGGDLAQGMGRHANALIITLFWGAIGGVLSATHSLWWHTSEAQDYDHHFNLGYVLRPLIGMILGGLIYALIALAFNTLSLDLPGSLLLGLIPSFLALVAGFRSGQLLRLVGFSPNVT